MFDESTGTHIVYIKNQNAPADMWLIHGFTECSESLQGVFETSIAQQFNIFIPDLPGFGKSCFEDKYLDLKNVITLLEQLITTYSSEKPLIILGHSLGATIATHLTANLLTRSENVIFFINVEGMLVEDKIDARSITKANDYENATEFVEYMYSRLKEGAESNPSLNRYLENIKKSDPNIVHAWAKSSTEMLAGNHIDSIYDRLACKNLYVHGEHTMSRLELENLKKVDYERVIIKGAGHWPMLEQADEFWRVVGELLGGRIFNY
ncbi:alpha/beta fold hydrolase [Parashewanella spongiae]|nr:alpha/beta hydrolase [Parashewanella spongiae]